MSEIREAVVVLCKCGKVHKTYGIRTEKPSGKRWNMAWAFPMKESTGKREGYDKVSVSGDIVMTDEYPGCPYCGQKNITVCSCGHMGSWSVLYLRQTKRKSTINMRLTWLNSRR